MPATATVGISEGTLPSENTLRNPAAAASAAASPWYRATIALASASFASRGCPASSAATRSAGTSVKLANHCGMSASGIDIDLPNCCSGLSVIPM